ncbi:MAG: carbohydrate kinase family protein [Candidatus Caldatribacteriaceae bacterium]
MKAEVVCFGEIVVDLFAEDKSISNFPLSFFSIPGGAGVNVAVALCRLGVRSTLMGKIGEDIFGRFLRDSLVKEGVDIQGLAVDRRTSTAVTVVFRKKHDPLEPLFVRYGRADMDFQSENVSWQLLENGQILHFVSLCLIKEPMRLATWEILDFCVRKGVLIFLDINHRPLLWKNLSEAREVMLQAAQRVDFLKLTQEELDFLTGYQDPRKGAKILLSQGVRNCIVTLGREGAFFANAQGEGFVPAFSVSTIDPTGCGDAFCAGYIREILLQHVHPGEILSEEQFRKTVIFASACGALTALKKRENFRFPTLEEVEGFLYETQKLSPP